MTPRGHASALAAMIAVSAASPAAAVGHLQVGTTLIELHAGASAGRFSLLNTGDAPVAAQVRVFTWSQDGSEDRLAPTTALVLSPPISEIAPGGEQVVRVITQVNGPIDRDQVYRVIVDELPRPDTAAGTISIRMRYVVPLYVRSAKASPPVLTCWLQPGVEPGTVLSCQNTGGQAAQLGATTLTGGGRTYQLTPGLFGYVLPGSKRNWALDAAKLASLGRPLTLDTQLNGRPASLPLASAH